MTVTRVPAPLPGLPGRRVIVAGAWVRVAVAAFAAFLTLATAQAADPAAPTPRDVRGWLMRIHEAASQRNFQGTFVASAGGTASNARIAHFCVGDHQYERSETLDGEARKVYRHDDWVLTAWPATRVATLEQRERTPQFPALLSAGDDHLADHYALQSEGRGRVAGREAEVSVVQPQDGLRYGYRVWADRATGLLLRLDTLGANDQVLESSAFSDLAIDVKPQPESVLAPMKKLEGYQVRRPALVPTRLEVEGWALREAVPGFQLVSCVRRPMSPLGGGADKEEPPRPVVQAIYADGLTYVSIFIEPYDPARHKTPMQTALGATQTLMQPRGDAWLTLIGDVPPATLRLFARSLERRK